MTRRIVRTASSYFIAAVSPKPFQQFSVLMKCPGKHLLASNTINGVEKDGHGGVARDANESFKCAEKAAKQGNVGD